MSKICVIAIVLVLNGLAWAQKPVAALPRTQINTTWNPPVGGTTWAAHTSAQLASSITNSSPGDIIVLDAGVTYSGNFYLPAKANANNKWIYIVSSAMAKLPVGQRVSPTSAADMPKIVTPNALTALQINNGANHWRLAGLEITAASNYPTGCGVAGHPNCMSYFLVSPLPSPSPLADSITIDRCYIHGSPTQDIQSAVVMNASHFAVVHSYISEIHDFNTDSTGVSGYWTPGPLTIVDNYISSSTENIMFGGGGGAGNPYVPSDITVRGNYLFKPLAWVQLSVVQRTMTVKDALEIKSAQRVLFDSNTIENVWSTAMVLTVRTSQSGDIAVVNDITITNNILKNVASGISTLAKDDSCGAAGGYPNCRNAGSQDRWYIFNNLVTFYDPKITGGKSNYGIMLNPGLDRINGNVPGVLRDVVFQHNTLIPAADGPCWNSVYFSVPNGEQPPFVNLTKNIWLLDNALCRQPTGDWGQQGTSGLTQYMGNPAPLAPRFLGNVMYVPVGDSVQTFPLHNFATTVPFTYVSATSGDYQLVTPDWTDTSDGKLAGINYSTLSRALSSAN
jgi:hypothetical protein